MTVFPPYCPGNVRVGTIEDAASLYFLLVEDLRAANDMGYPVSHKKVAATIGACLRGESGIVGLIDGPDGIVAAIGIQASQPWYSDRWLLSETFVFVHPDFRKGTGYGDDLMKFAEWHKADMSSRIGEEIDLERSVMSFKRLPAKMRFWGRYGKQIGAIYLTGNGHE